MSENNQRDVASRMVFTLAEIQRDFEAARTQALAKWNEELDASGVRASHSATEALGQASEWFQQETRSRLQVLVEQALASANTGLETKVAEAAQKFETRLTEQANDRVAQVSQNIEWLGDEVAARTKTRLEAAAETAASSFGEIVRGISNQEMDILGQRSQLPCRNERRNSRKLRPSFCGIWKPAQTHRSTSSTRSSAHILKAASRKDEARLPANLLRRWTGIAQRGMRTSRNGARN